MKALKRFELFLLSIRLMLITDLNKRHYKIISLLDAYPIEDLFRVVAMMDGFFYSIVYSIASSTIHATSKLTGTDERWKI